MAGVAWAMNHEGGRDIVLPPDFGADLLINSRVPVGGGLSSSAALECSTALALLDLSCPLRPGCPEADELPSDRSPGNDALRARLAQVCITAENKVAGAHTGGWIRRRRCGLSRGRRWWWISVIFRLTRCG